jgi:predicted metalloprotease
MAALVLFSALSPTASANISIKQEIISPLIIAQRMTGAWSTVATNDPSVKKAAEKAIVVQADKTGESLELLSIRHLQ